MLPKLRLVSCLMGLTKEATGNKIITNNFSVLKHADSDITVCLAGNPNVGKSTVFNALTGMHQHTGNWAGKTVETAVGTFWHIGRRIVLIDTPGTYSLDALSAEEEVARDFILNGDADVCVIVCDATSFERNLNLCLQISKLKRNTILCLNFIDEADKKDIIIDNKRLSVMLGIPVISVSARNNKGLDVLRDEIVKLKDIGNHCTLPTALYTPEKICEECICSSINPREKDGKIDLILAGKITAFPFMLLLLLLTFWITIKGANYPSQLLSNILFSFEKWLYNALAHIGVPLFINELFTHGIFRTLAWIVSVMLPPMAIFFPLFTLLEDSGYLPRIAFCLDRCFKKCNACGKQSLTMCMGFGCNAAGIIGCRIIDSKRERLIAILTNSLVPCNGRFPLLISIITMFFVNGMGGSFLSALMLTALILLSVSMTFLASFILSKTVLRGVPSAFTLELPPYRRPQIIKTLTRSIFDRTLFVLYRAVISAIPAGLIIWLAANITVSGATLLTHTANFLNPFANLLGLDGVILLAFLLGMPANEIVIPIIIMAYLGGGNLQSISNLSALKSIFVDNGWTILTALNVMLFSLFHWPCTTSILTVKKETGSLKWTALAFILPTIIGIIVCMLTTLVYNLII